MLTRINLFWEADPWLVAKWTIQPDIRSDFVNNRGGHPLKSFASISEICSGTGLFP